MLKDLCIPVRTSCSIWVTGPYVFPCITENRANVSKNVINSLATSTSG